MRILSIEFLSTYKQFEAGVLINFPNHDAEGLQFSFLCGKNGSGKTTVMSLIAQIFYNLRTHQEGIPASLKLKYKIKADKINYDLITLTYRNKFLFFHVEGKTDEMIVLDESAFKHYGYRQYFKRKVGSQKYVRFKAIAQYLPTSVTVSSFSLHGEWPYLRKKIEDERFVQIHDISGIYGLNHYTVPSITRGICRFLKSFFDNKDDLQPFFKHLDILYSGRVKIHKKFPRNKTWKKVDLNNIEEFVANCELGIYEIDDIEFNRTSKMITLDNMSSGEKMLLYRLFSILNSIENEGLVFIEEPELHLDPVWKHQLISIFQSMFRNYNAHFIISSHSPSLLNTVESSQLIFIENGAQKEINQNTYLIDEVRLTALLYPEDKIFNSVEQEVLNIISNIKDKDTLERYITTLGTSVFQVIAMNKLKLMNEKS